jgi:Protein of unknown function (DUF1573)/Abnormal spindle-like microcephaly-assoc'd, ASPM-SPD-2-Hydin
MTHGQARAVGMQSKAGRKKLKTIFSLFLIASITPIFSFVAGCAGLVTNTKQNSSTVGSFQLNPANVNFGQVAIGKQTTQTVSVTNIGNVAVNIVKVSVSDGHFTVAGMTTPMALAVGQALNITISVAPTTVGALTATLTVQGDSGSPAMTVNLSATGMSSQPQLVVNPTVMNFGNVSTGLKTTNNLVLTNTGSTNLTISLLALTGADFSISGITTPATLTAGQSAQLAVSFSPAASGSSSGSLLITSNDPVNPTLNVTLSGTGTSTPTGQLNASSNNISFGAVATGATAEQQIVLTNAGNAAVTISSVTANGAGMTASGIEIPGTLNPAESATLKASFAPTSAGSVIGSITVVSNAANSPLKMAVTGTGAQPGLSISPSSYNFGNVIDGQTKSQTFTVTNTGTGALTITQLASSGGGYTVSGLTTPATIASGSSTTFSVLFAPTTAGSLGGTVSLVSNAPNSPNILSLSGTGTAASVTLSANPASLSFTNVNAGSSSSKSVTISNSGNTSVTLSQLSVSAKDFSVSGITTPVTLGAGQNASINVTFQPSVSENVTGSITVASSQGANAVIAVSGNGVQPALSITPSSVGFGNVTVGSPASQTIQLQNSGTGSLTVTQVGVTGSGFTLGTVALPVTLSSGQTSSFNVQFNPTAAGGETGSVSVVSNAANSPAVIGLSGTGIAATQTLTFSTTSIAFGNVNAGASATQSVTLTNSGNSSVTVSQISESGSGFSLAGAGTPVTLSAGQTMTFGVVFSPSATGSESGSVTVTSSASGSPKTIALSGTGVQLNHSVTLSWTASSSTVSGYNIYRTSVSGSGYAKINSGLISGLTYTDTTVQSGSTYYYVATAVDASGDESTDSNQAAAIVP